MGELNTIKIKGKDYVQVDERLRAFREVHPTWTIDTNIIDFNEDSVLMKTVISDDNGKVIGTGYAREEKNASMINKTSFIENCETSCVGRAIAIATGIGVIGSICSADEVKNAIDQQEQVAIKEQKAPKKKITLLEAMDTTTSKGTKYGDMDMDKLQWIIDNSTSDRCKECASIVLEYKRRQDIVEDIPEIEKTEDMPF